MNTKRLLFGVSVALFILVFCILDIFVTISMFAGNSNLQWFHIIFVIVINCLVVMIVTFIILYASRQYHNSHYVALLP